MGVRGVARSKVKEGLFPARAYVRTCISHVGGILRRGAPLLWCGGQNRPCVLSEFAALQKFSNAIIFAIGNREHLHI